MKLRLYSVPHSLHSLTPLSLSPFNFCKSRSSLAGFGSAAISSAFDDAPLFGGEDFLEERGVRANSRTYLWLLQGCVGSGTLDDARKLHSRVLKLGFHGDAALCDTLVEAYLAFGDSDGALKALDEIPQRSLALWNKTIHWFLENNLFFRVLGVYQKMVKDNVGPDGTTYVKILKSCSGGDVGLRCIEQIHGRVFRRGFGNSPLVCNLLVDLYSKRGFVDSAKKVFGNLRLRDSVSWVAMISGLSQNGREEEAVLLFCEMHTSGILPTPYVFSSVLSACTKVDLLRVGMQIHNFAFKGGFSCETYVCNALVTLYARSGNLISAENIFSAMQSRDGVSYNALISGLSQRGYSDRAQRLFRKMQVDRLKPDCVTVASLLSACASVGALDKGTQLHSFAIKAGMSSDLILEGSLLDLYVKCSDLKTAHKFFLMTGRDNVVLWNVMLVAYGEVENLSKSFEMFSQMQIQSIIPNDFTYPSILRTCTAVGETDLGEQIHSQVIKTGFQFNVYVCSVLIDMYAKLGKLDIALGILRRITGADVVSWTAMIAGYTQHGLFSESLKLFEEMKYRGIRPDNIGYASAITACAGLKSLNQGRQVHAQSCLTGYSNDVSISNALVSLYSRCGRISEAYLAFEKNDAKDNISWNALISGFAQSGYSEESLQVYSKMNRAGIKANLFTFGSTVSAAANLANIKQGQQIHAMILKTGYNSEPEASNVLITLYSKSGRINDAKREFYEMPEKNEVSWNAMITACSQHGCGLEALHLFEQMKWHGVSPSHITFIAVLSACSHVGLVNEGLAYFESMSKEHGLVPKPEHYVCIVDLLGRAGLLNDAKEFIEKMPGKPDVMVWRTLLSACTVHRNREIGEFAAQYLLSLEPKDSATYVLLSNMYAVTGQWDFRDQTRKLMKERGVKKEPGRSWIEVNNSFHSFFVGDRLHPLSDRIYDFLADLNKRASAIGYMQERYSLLSDEEQEQRDSTIYIHSEKLAITFGLLSVTSNCPVHVIKNLRICRDCHNWIKYVSRISNRAIVVRDAYRFHHFEDGVCSCRDYW